MAQLVSSLASLLRQTTITDDEEILRAVDLALKSSGKGDVDTQHVKVVALLKLDRYAEALQLLETGSATLQTRAALEHAYALYKTGKSAAAVEIASRQPEQRAFQHVEAQAAYRAEDFQRAAQIYRSLQEDLSEDAEADLRVNSGAADAQLEWAGKGNIVQKKKPSREDLEAFETAYNAACGSIARGELAQSEILLRRAKDLCITLEDLSAEERQAELLPMTAQQIYVLLRLGRRAEAEALADELDVAAVPGASSQHIAQINKLAATATSANPFLAQRLANQDPKSLASDALFQFQVDGLRKNDYASSLNLQKFDGTAASTKQVLAGADAPASIDVLHTTAGVVNAAAHARGQTGKDALKHILPLLEQRPHDVGLILTITHLYVLAGNPASATSLLESFLARLEESDSASAQSSRFAPGLVGTLVSLYHSQGRNGPLRNELAKAASYWRTRSQTRSAGVIDLLKAAGAALLQSLDPQHLQLARDIFSDLYAHDSSDRYAAAGLLAANPAKASAAQHANLTSIERLVASIDAEALENAGVAQIPPSLQTSTTKKRAAADETKRPKKARKIRATHMPKDYDPKRVPDPERWLPLRDRSSYRPKGKKAKARALLSQGTALVDSDSSRPVTPAAEVLKAKQSGGGGGGTQKKKKGKGGKW